LCRVRAVTDVLFEFYINNRSKIRETWYFLRRVETKEIISYLKSNPKTAELMKKTFRGQ
jgi:hypothetical protein